MNAFTCIDKIKENGNISYELQDSAGKKVLVSDEKLKALLKSNKIKVVNLIIDSSGNIADDPNYQKKVMIAKIKMFGKQYESDCGHIYYVLESPNTSILYIPDDVEYITKPYVYDFMNSLPPYRNIECNTFKVIGGSGLKSASAMFAECKAQNFDFSDFDTSNVANMNHMFGFCKAQSLDLSCFDTSNVTTMKGMFLGCIAISLDLSSFDTSNVTNMCGMFSQCTSNSLNLSSFDTSKVTDMTSMFYHCKAESLDLSSFDTSKVTKMESMFEHCQASSLDLRSFDTSNVTNMSHMFDDCQAKIIANDKRIKQLIK